MENTVITQREGGDHIALFHLSKALTPEWYYLVRSFSSVLHRNENHHFQAGASFKYAADLSRYQIMFWKRNKK